MSADRCPPVPWNGMQTDQGSHGFRKCAPMTDKELSEKFPKTSEPARQSPPHGDGPGSLGTLGGQDKNCPPPQRFGTTINDNYVYGDSIENGISVCISKVVAAQGAVARLQ